MNPRKFIKYQTNDNRMKYNTEVQYTNKQHKRYILKYNNIMNIKYWSIIVGQMQWKRDTDWLEKKYELDKQRACMLNCWRYPKKKSYILQRFHIIRDSNVRMIIYMILRFSDLIFIFSFSYRWGSSPYFFSFCYRKKVNIKIDTVNGMKIHKTKYVE